MGLKHAFILPTQLRPRSLSQTRSKGLKCAHTHPNGGYGSKWVYVASLARFKAPESTWRQFSFAPPGQLQNGLSRHATFHPVSTCSWLGLSPVGHQRPKNGITCQSDQYGDMTGRAGGCASVLGTAGMAPGVRFPSCRC